MTRKDYGRLDSFTNNWLERNSFFANLSKNFKKTPHFFCKIHMDFYPWICFSKDFTKEPRLTKILPFCHLNLAAPKCKWCRRLLTMPGRERSDPWRPIYLLSTMYLNEHYQIKAVDYVTKYNNADLIMIILIFIKTKPLNIFNVPIRLGGLFF